jgi:tetratricopeptide (TPR) repeat protein
MSVELEVRLEGCAVMVTELAQHIARELKARSSDAADVTDVTCTPGEAAEAVLGRAHLVFRLEAAHGAAIEVRSYAVAESGQSDEAGEWVCFSVVSRTPASRTLLALAAACLARACNAPVLDDALLFGTERWVAPDDLLAAAIRGAADGSSTPLEAPLVVRTPEELELYLDVRGATHRRQQTVDTPEGPLVEVDAKDAAGGPAHYVFRVRDDQGRGLGTGRSECLEVPELWDYAQRLAAELPADPRGYSDAQQKTLRRVMSIADQVLRLYDPGASLPAVSSAEARAALSASPVRYRQDVVAAAADSWSHRFTAVHEAKPAAPLSEAPPRGRPPSQSPPGPAASALAGAGPIAAAREVEARFSTAHSLYLSMNDKPLLAKLLLQRGREFEQASAPVRAREDFEQARKLCHEIGDTQGEASAYVRLGWLSHAAADLRSARTHFDRALALYKSISDSRGEADALWGRGALWSLGRDADSSESDLQEALQRFHDLGSTDGVAAVLSQRAGLRTKVGLDPGGAEHDAQESARLYAELARGERKPAPAEAGPVREPERDLQREADALRASARQLCAASDWDAASSELERALALYEQLGEPIALANALVDRARLRQARAELDGSAADLARALKTYDALDSELGRANVFECGGDLHVQRGDLHEAQAQYERALTLYERLGIAVGIANTHAELARTALALADFERARRHAEQALAAAGSDGSRYAIDTAQEILTVLATR